MVVVGIAMLQGARHAHLDAIERAANELGIDVKTAFSRCNDVIMRYFSLVVLILKDLQSVTL